MAGRYGVDPLVLMERYTAVDQVHMDIKKLNEIAQGLPEDMESFLSVILTGILGMSRVRSMMTVLG